MRLRSKIHLYSSVLFAVLLILMNLATYYTFSQLSMNNQLHRAEAQTLQIANAMRQVAGEIPTQDLLRGYVPINGMIQMLGPDGTSLAPVTSVSQQHLSQLPGVYDTNKKVQVFDDLDQRYVMVSIPVIWSDGVVMNIQVTESIQSTMDTLRVLRLVLIVVTCVALIPVLVSIRLLSAVIMKPISAMTLTMKEIRRSGRFNRLQLQGQSKDELMEMSMTFNDMIELLENNYKKQEQFVANASHELKTPLTIIESYANLLRRRGLDRPEIFTESIEAIHSEAMRMKDMTEQLLLLAKHKEQWNIRLDNVNLTELTIGSAKAFRNAYGKEIRVNGQPEVFGYSDESKLKQLLFIFLDNAQKYSDDDIVVEVGALSDDRFIRIIDRGIGIAKDKLPYVFDRFYRVDEARTRQAGGAGLGLSLAVEIAEAIGVRIELDSVEGEGTTAELWIPEGNVIMRDSHRILI
ncbi:sensor histidine kinase [Paenibacillus crassostreae]|uniref:histidine kinase n=1 Tax=Paenibacillus crassostreae TaxID=1763538 RepID=A0A167AQC4_9BACL|nr:HAMP domain-containing sensor histidine kinase [Paenibacillus crassostreae]AOZ93775.1 two-component sensor histidine kinase [Paenibacillus crassostreae]OAB71310.1 histidine kinase [Paenibacillus crassostreae]